MARAIPSIDRSLAGRIMARLLTLVVALNALLPAGFMPDFKALGHGRIEIVLCTADGPSLITLDRDGKLVPKPPAGKGKVSNHSPCAWAPVLSKIFLASVDLPTRAGPSIHTVQQAQPIDRIVADRVDHLPLGSRAPPLPVVQS